MQNGVDDQHLCPHCGRGFKRRGQLVIHIRRHTGERPFVCDLCGRGFAYKGGLNAHKKIHSQIKPHTCDICEQSFKDKGTLRRHILRHIGERNYICKICNKGFTTDSSLNTHLTTHRGKNSFICDICGKGFLFRQRLKKHVSSVHLKIKQHACEICGKLFTQRYNLTKHLKGHQKPYVCGICGKAFALDDYLTRHLLKHNPEASPGPICDEEVTNEEKSVLQAPSQEKLVATDESPICTICNKKLKSIQTLKQHMKTHERNLYECPVCDKNFISLPRFQAHIKHHAVKEIPDAASDGSSKENGSEETILEGVRNITDINNELASGSVENTIEIINDCNVENFESVNVLNTCNEKTIDNIETVTEIFKEEIVEHLQTVSDKIQDHSSLGNIENNHPLDKVISSLDSYECEICNKEFTSRKYLNRHMLTHNEKLFKCTICAKKFMELHRFKAHLTSHTDKEFLDCSSKLRSKETSIFIREDTNLLNSGSVIITQDIAVKTNRLEPEKSLVIKEEINEIFIKEEMPEDVFVSYDTDDELSLETENIDRHSFDAEDPLV